MKPIAVLLILGASACAKEADQAAQQPPAEVTVPAASNPMAPEAKPAMLEVPDDKAQLQRLLAMGYTVHEEHLHPPGTKECPFDMGGGVVQ